MTQDETQFDEDAFEAEVAQAEAALAESIRAAEEGMGTLEVALNASDGELRDVLESAQKALEALDAVHESAE